MKRVYVAQNQVEAQLVRDRLEAAGIPATVKADTVAAPSIPFPAVWVDASNVERAIRLLEDR
jgi:hypothetical protein